MWGFFSFVVDQKSKTRSPPALLALKYKDVEPFLAEGATRVFLGLNEATKVTYFAIDLSPIKAKSPEALEAAEKSMELTFGGGGGLPG